MWCALLQYTPHHHNVTLISLRHFEVTRFWLWGARRFWVWVETARWRASFPDPLYFDLNHWKLVTEDFVLDNRGFLNSGAPLAASLDFLGLCENELPTRTVMLACGAAWHLCTKRKHPYSSYRGHCSTSSNRSHATCIQVVRAHNHWILIDRFIRRSSLHSRAFLLPPRCLNAPRPD